VFQITNYVDVAIFSDSKLVLSMAVFAKPIKFAALNLSNLLTVGTWK